MLSERSLEDNKNKNRNLPIKVLAILALALILRFAFISADLPLFLSNAQDDIYDSPWYVADAQYIVQGRDVHFQEGWLKLIWTGYFTVVFKLIGPGVWQGNAGTAFIGTLCVLLIYNIIKRVLNGRYALIAALLTATNFILVMYSRTPLPYIGTCAAALLCIFLWLSFHKKPKLLFIPYLLAIVFTFHLKSVTAIILPSIILTDLYFFLGKSSKEEKLNFRPFLYVAIAIIITASFAFIVFPETISRYFTTRYETYVGSLTISELIRRILSFGVETRFFIRMPVLWLLAFIYPVFFIFRHKEKAEIEKRLGLAAILWLFTGFIAFGFLKYRSLHYFIILCPAIIILATLFLKEISSTRDINLRSNNPLSRILIFILITYFSYQLISVITLEIVRSGDISDFLANSVGVNRNTKALTFTNFGMFWALSLSIALAFILAIAWHFMNRRFLPETVSIKDNHAGYAAYFTASLSIFINLFFYSVFLSDLSYSASHIPDEMPHLVEKNALLAEHGSSLAGYGNNLKIIRKGFDFFRGRAPSNDTTHLFVNYFRLERIRPLPPFQESSYLTPVAIFTVKKVPSVLFRLKELPPDYELSLFEEGMVFFREGEYQEANEKFKLASEKHPESGMIKSLKGISLFKTKLYEEAEKELRKAVYILPEDLFANTYLAACLTAQKNFEEALELIREMRKYYELDLRMKRFAFKFEETLIRNPEPDAETLLKEFEIITGY